MNEVVLTFLKVDYFRNSDTPNVSVFKNDSLSRSVSEKPRKA